jgi:xylulokinase
VSGSGQQHGSVYWKKGAGATLQALSPGSTLASQLASSFSIENSPNWMDSSTSAQCATLEKALGGPEATSDALGSRAYERFTGNQIAKLAATTGFDNTERISLVSSAFCSIFTGKHCAIDISDGAGMNLMDLRTKEWHTAACAASLAPVDLLGPSPVPAHQIAGSISNYFVGTPSFRAI